MRQCKHWEKVFPFILLLIEFLEKAFGESQEMVVFVTELNTNYYSIWFLKENDCGLYYKYNKGLLFDERHQEILKQMDEAEESMERGIR